uniref:Uncharacterized protein n=1 Tax=Ixodes ricinus TaxID=34613 RepID=V5HIA4_IXORI
MLTLHICVDEWSSPTVGEGHHSFFPHSVDVRMLSSKDNSSQLLSYFFPVFDLCVPADAHSSTSLRCASVRFASWRVFCSQFPLNSSSFLRQDDNSPVSLSLALRSRTLDLWQEIHCFLNASTFGLLGQLAGTLNRCSSRQSSFLDL